MKKYLVLGLLLILFGDAEAQHIRARRDFPVGVVITAPGPPPFARAIWIGPEWRWSGGDYVLVPGYWAKPRRRARWVAGHWVNHRRGYVWVAGRWR